LSAEKFIVGVCIAQSNNKHPFDHASLKEFVEEVFKGKLHVKSAKKFLKRWRKPNPRRSKVMVTEVEKFVRSYELHQTLVSVSPATTINTHEIRSGTDPSGLFAIFSRDAMNTNT
jgi:Lhr-like helicase